MVSNAEPIGTAATVGNDRRIEKVAPSLENVAWMSCHMFWTLSAET